MGTNVNKEAVISSTFVHLAQAISLFVGFRAQFGSDCPKEAIDALYALMDFDYWLFRELYPDEADPVTKNERI